MVLHFKPDPTLPLDPTGLPEPGRGGKIEAKVIVGEGAGHGLWKAIEAERERWSQKQREENTLRAFEAFGAPRILADRVAVYTAGQREGETRLL